MKLANRTHIYSPNEKAWKLELTKGLYALVDGDDFDKVKDMTWYAHICKYNTYARSDVYSDGVKSRVYLHRYLLGAPKGTEVDHINGDVLDNRKQNLRVCSKAENTQNRMKCRFNATSKYKGVSWDKRFSCWHAYIDVDGKRKNLGWFKDEIGAAKAYDAAATKYFGEYALLNA